MFIVHFFEDVPEGHGKRDNVIGTFLNKESAERCVEDHKYKTNKKGEFVLSCGTYEIVEL